MAVKTSWTAGDVLTAADLTDTFAAKLTTPGAWTNYTPTWTATGGSPAIGNGTLAGRYVQFGKIVHAFVYIYGGSTTTWTGTFYKFTLPVAASGSNNNDTGAAHIYNANTGTNYVGAIYMDATTNFAIGTNSGFIGAAIPGTWANNWILRAFITYEAA